MTAEEKKLRDSMWDFKDSPPISVEDMSPEHRVIYEEAMASIDAMEDNVITWGKKCLEEWRGVK
jgi:hypothetical protein